MAAILALSASASAAPAGSITEFSAGLNPEAVPIYIVAGADGNLWFTDSGTTPAIGRITPSGTITEFSENLVGPSPPSNIALGPDGNVWFTSCCTSKAIGKITPSGSITEFTSLPAGAQPGAIASGPDGNLWFTDRGTTKAIGKITPAGSITEYSTGLNPGSNPSSIAPGADGNLWFTDVGTTKAIGRITPSGSIEEFTAGLMGNEPQTIAPGADGNMWFYAEGGTGAIGSVTPSGSISLFSAGLSGHDPEDIAPGADGNLWLADNNGIATGVIGQFTLSGTLNESFSGLNPEANPIGIAPGPDGNVWFTDFGKTRAIGRVVPETLPSPLAVSGGGTAGSAQLCSASWPTWAGQQPSATLYGFDGYRWLLNGVQVSSGPSYTPSVASTGSQLACAETATYPLLNVTRLAASPSVTVVAPIPTGGPAKPAVPVVGSAQESAKRWREGGRLAQISKRKRSKRTPVGTTFSFSLNEVASVTFSFNQAVTGRKAGRKCVATTRANARRRRCTRTVRAGMLSFSGHPGTNKVVFQGRISGSKKLKPGAYTLLITASNSAGQRSSPQKLTFVIVK